MPAIPERFAALAADLTQALEAYQPPPAPAGQPPDTLWASEVHVVNPLRGTALLGPHVQARARLLMARLKELGIRCVVLNVHEDLVRAKEVADYLGLYSAVIDDARALGLQVVIETSASFRAGAYADQPDLALHTANRKTAVDTILDRFGGKLLCLVVADEPRAEWALTQVPELRDRATYTKFVAHLLEGTVGGPCLLGAGCTASEPISWAKSLMGLDTQVFSIHNYDAHKLAQMDAMAKLATLAGKRIVAGEVWAAKALTQEWLTVPAKTLLARDIYGFFDGLDALFLEKLAGMAAAHRFLVCSPFWLSHRAFFGLPYTSKTCRLGYDAGWAAVALGADRALQLGSLTSLGLAAKRIMGGG